MFGIRLAQAIALTLLCSVFLSGVGQVFSGQLTVKRKVRSTNDQPDTVWQDLDRQMSNEEVSIDWKCISSGGSQFSDGEFVMSGTLGQTAVGDANDGETGVRLGYWQILTPETACGDVNMSGYIDIDDIIYLIAYIFTGGPPPEPLEVGDLNCIEDVDVDDVMYLISYVFLGGAYPCDPNDDGIPDC